MLCPNKSSKEWKHLISKVGEDVALEMFINNGFDIPNVSSVDVNPIKRNEFGNEKFSAVHTKSLISDNPEIASEIISKLQEQMPEANISKNGLIGSDGQWVDIKPGEQGMHRRNAFQSVVAWANDSYLETPPHEYAHHYIDTFRNHPLVKKGIEKYGEERLATIMGKYYAGQIIAPTTESYIVRFWDMVRSFFGSPNVAKILATKFYEGEKLNSALYAGSNIVQYQKQDEAIVNNKVDGYLNNQGFSVSDVAPESDASVLKKMREDEIKFRAKEEDLIKGIVKEEDSHDNISYLTHLQKEISEFKSYIAKVEESSESQMAGIHSGITEKVEDILLETDKAKRDALLYDIRALVKAKDSAGVAIKDTNSVQVFDYLKLMYKHKNYLKEIENKLIVDDNKTVYLPTYNNKVDDEIKENTQLRKERKDKVPAWLGKAFEYIEKGAKHLTGQRLHALFVSGSINSALSEVYYKALNKAEEVRVDIINKFEDTVIAPEELKKSSAWLSGARNINDLETKSFLFNKTEDNPNGEPLKLTHDEIINLYLVLRQTDKGKWQASSPRESIIDNGFSLKKSELEGRNVSPKKKFKISSMTESMIMRFVEDNYSGFVANIDKGLDDVFIRVDKTHNQMFGSSIEQLPNYFPMRYAGSKKFKFGVDNRMLTEFSASFVRPGGDSVVEITGATEILHQHKMGSSLYSSFAVPLQNAKKVINHIKKEHSENKIVQTYLDDMQDVLRLHANKGVAISNLESEKGIATWSKKITSNFAVSVLGMNFPVMMKQPVSYSLARGHVEDKYLQEVGFGMFGIVGVNPKDVFKQLAITGTKEGETWMPIEWKFDEENDTFKLIKELSPKLYHRLKGNSSRETGEVMLESPANDLVKIPVMKKDGKPIFISKKRMMEGIRIFDSATIMSIWKAVEAQAKDKYQMDPKSQEYKDYVKNKVEEVVELTQPTYDISNMAKAHYSGNPLIRILTMFGSARSKIGMQVIESVYNYYMHPTKENRDVLLNRIYSGMIQTSLMIAAINLAKAAVVHGFDEPEEKLLQPFAMDSFLNTTAGFFGVGDIVRLVATRMDDKLWKSGLDHPLPLLVEGTADGIAAVFQGDIGKASHKLLNSYFNATGAPAFLINFPKQIYKGRTK